MTDDESYMHDLLTFDPLSTAEKATGKSYKEDRDTSGLGFSMHIMHNKLKQEELVSRGDTYYGMPFEDALEIFENMGFEIVHQRHFSYEGVRETSFVMWSEAGLLATLESYRASTLNMGKVLYNIRFNEDVENIFRLTSSGTMTDSDIWVGDHDIREGGVFNLKQLEKNGEFITPWVQRPWLWFPTYVDSKVPGYDYAEINERVISELPVHVRKAITP